MERVFPFLEVLAPLLEDSEFTDIVWNARDGIWIKSRSSARFVHSSPSPWNTQRLLEEWSPFLSAHGCRWSAHRPWCQLKWNHRFRMHFVFPPVSPVGPLLTIRRISTEERTLYWQNDPAFQMLRSGTEYKKNTLIFGSTGSGKSTLLSELVDLLPSHERILLLEDHEELETRHPHVIRLIAQARSIEGSPEITLQSLLREGLRMSPSRILIGECRGGEVMELLMAMHLGHEGVLSTLHATNARDCLTRLEFMAALAAPQLPPERIRLLLSQTLHMLVHVDHRNGQRSIRSVHELAGFEGGTILLRPVVEHRS